MGFSEVFLMIRQCDEIQGSGEPHKARASSLRVEGRQVQFFAFGEPVGLGRGRADLVAVCIEGKPGVDVQVAEIQIPVSFLSAQGCLVSV